jgi:hypothetical protein
MYSLTNGKTDASSDHVMEIDLWFIEGTICGCSLFSSFLTVPTRRLFFGNAELRIVENSNLIDFRFNIQTILQLRQFL